MRNFLLGDIKSTFRNLYKIFTTCYKYYNSEKLYITCSIAPEKEKFYIPNLARHVRDISLAREMRKVRRDVFTSDENSGRRSVRRQIYRRLKWRGDLVKTAWQPRLCQRLCQSYVNRGTLPTAGRYFHRRDDDYVYRHDNGRRLRATGANDRSGNLLSFPTERTVCRTICLHRGIKESSLARFSSTYARSSSSSPFSAEKW